MAALVLQNVNDSVLGALQSEAAQRGVSAEALAVEILEAALPSPPLGLEENLAFMASCRAQTLPSHKTPSEEIVRQMREER